MNEFNRNVWCLMGLPFDAIDLNTTVKKVHEAVRSKTSCFISTPNLNFLIASRKDIAFRNSVINSDLSVADGKPLIWLARLLNIPLPERVAGSDLIEALVENKEGYEPLKVFFFGGQDGVAEQACAKLNSQDKGLKCVGIYNPGFGSVEKMSSSNIINTINQADADFIIVSLGAKKGQAWIEMNKNKLNAPVISHLGAVVNFIAGNVKRAPKIFQKLGLEWLWRIKEEPKLWKRYFFDFIALLNIVAFKVIPLFIILRKQNLQDDECEINIDEKDDITAINFRGSFGIHNMGAIKERIKNIKFSSKKVNIVLEDVRMDESFIGMLIIMKKELMKLDSNLQILTHSKVIKKHLKYSGCDDLLLK